MRWPVVVDFPEWGKRVGQGLRWGRIGKRPSETKWDPRFTFVLGYHHERPVIYRGDQFAGRRAIFHLEHKRIVSPKTEALFICATSTRHL